MSKSKPTVSNVFSEEMIRNRVLSQYGLEKSKIKIVKFKDTDKQRAVYKITYKKRSYCLKKVYFDEENLLFVYSALEWLFKNNINTPKLLDTLSGTKYVKVNGMLFILTIWIEGNKCSFTETSHVITAARQLGYMHKCSVGFTPIKGSKKREGLSNIYITTLKHFNQILLSYNCAIKSKDYFSNIFLDCFDENLEIAKFSLELSSKINHQNLSKSLCHGDYVSKNLLFDKRNNIWLIDLDKCKVEYSMYDFGYFLRRLLRRDKVDWNIELTLRIIREYNTAHTLSIDDFRYLLSYLCFPQKYWKISRDYYRNISKCNKPFYLELIYKATDKTTSHLKFVKEIKARIENEYNIQL